MKNNNLSCPSCNYKYSFWSSLKIFSPTAFQCPQCRTIIQLSGPILFHTLLLFFLGVILSLILLVSLHTIFPAYPFYKLIIWFLLLSAILLIPISYLLYLVYLSKLSITLRPNGLKWTRHIYWIIPVTIVIIGLIFIFIYLFWPSENTGYIMSEGKQIAIKKYYKYHSDYKYVGDKIKNGMTTERRVFESMSAFCLN